MSSDMVDFETTPHIDQTTNFLLFPNMKRFQSNIIRRGKDAVIAKSVKEPKRKSFLDILQQNFNLHERSTFVHRLIYIGKFLVDGPLSEDKSLIDSFRRSIKLINDRYFDEKLSGFLLMYAKHFCHVLEGSEESLMRFLTSTYENEVLKSKMGPIKLLATFHHVNQRLTEDWMILVATTNAFSEEDDLKSEDKSAYDYKRHCIEKLYQLGLSLRQNKIPEQPDPPSRVSSRRRIKSKSTSASKDAVVKVSVFLPNLESINYLVDCSETSNLKNYIEGYNRISHLDSYEGTVWPIPCDYMPMHTFRKDIDPIGPLGALNNI